MQDQIKQSNAHKLGLGCVQFGLPYGAFNQNGQVPIDEVAAILNASKEAGIGLLDTAHAYGESEQVLGKVSAGAQFEITTKCPPLEEQADPATALTSYATESMTRLGVDRVYGYMLHRAEDLTDDVWAALSTLKQAGQAQKIGLSAYSPDEILTLHARYPFDIAQLPANALSPWLYDQAVLDALSATGIEIHVRSVFLQGFLLSKPGQLPDHLQPFTDDLNRFISIADNLGISQLALALAAVMRIPQIDRLIVGVDQLSQLEDILRACAASISTDLDLSSLACHDPNLTNPRRWP